VFLARRVAAVLGVLLGALTVVDAAEVLVLEPLGVCAEELGDDTADEADDGPSGDVLRVEVGNELSTADNEPLEPLD
jgi:hypothetical protein